MIFVAIPRWHSLEEGGIAKGTRGSLRRESLFCCSSAGDGGVRVVAGMELVPASFKHLVLMFPPVTDVVVPPVSFFSHHDRDVVAIGEELLRLLRKRLGVVELKDQESSMPVSLGDGAFLLGGFLGRNSERPRS